MSAQLRPRRRRSFNRRKNPRIAATAVPTVAYATPVVTIDTDQPVVVNSVPQWPLSTGELPASFVQVSPTQFTLTYAVGGVATGITIPDRSPAVRSNTKGYVAPGSYLFP